MASSSSGHVNFVNPSNQHSNLKARQHIDSIRKHKFSIGAENQNPLTEDLQNAVANLSSELYSKDSSFLMELIQNAEDNEYMPGVKPTIEFVMTTTDITGVGAPATLLVFNNEVGFSEKNINSICSVGLSTKKGQRHHGYIGEKGIGFKSVFMVSEYPHIFSNGYKIKFSEAPDQDCGIGYIVPEWVVAKPTVSDIHQLYGSDKVLPTTTIILPLKPAKVESVQKQLSKICPEILLFLIKIKQLLVREKNGGSDSESFVSPISISTETSQISLGCQDEDTRVVHLSVQEKRDSIRTACRFITWRQVFQVNSENMVDARRNMKECAITLAFALGPRLKSDIPSVGIFAFMPTAMVTKFPFMVQSDFILASSRESILLNNKWNLGIIDNIASTFTAAFTTLIKCSASSKLFSIAQVLHFLPIEKSPYEELNVVRDSIRTKLLSNRVVPCETFFNDKMVFCKTKDVIRILPEFTKILRRIQEPNGVLKRLSSLGKFILHNSVHIEEYEETWKFLGLFDSYEWYGTCIQSSGFMLEASTNEYVELLCFLANIWKCLPLRTVNKIPLIRYIDRNGETKGCSILEIRRKEFKIHVVWDAEKHAWLSKWNLEMGCPHDILFFPDAILFALLKTKKQHLLRQWMTSKFGAILINVSDYCSKIKCILSSKKKSTSNLAISFSHLVYHSYLKNYIGTYDTSNILKSLPIVSGSGSIVTCTETLVPESVSKWATLLDKNEACCFDKYVDLGEEYAVAGEFAGECTPERDLLEFLKKHGNTVDLLDILPQDAVLSVASTQLTCDQAILLLQWLRSLRARDYELPVKFIESIQNGKWIKTYSGFKSPNRCYLYDEGFALSKIVRSAKDSLSIDRTYYMEHNIRSYKDELLNIGVKNSSPHMGELLVYFNKHLASSSIGGNAYYLLHFIEELKMYSNKQNEDFMKTAKESKWLKTNKGYMSPSESVFVASKFSDAILQITDLYVVEREYYTIKLDRHVNNLKLLGVVVDLEDVYKTMPNHLRLPADISTITKESALLLLGCIRHLGPAATELTQKLMWQPWIKTVSGFRCPTQAILYSDEWEYFFNVVPLPIIDEAFYGDNIKSYKVELEAIGVIVDADEAYTLFSEELESSLSRHGLSSDTVISLLECVKSMLVALPSKLPNLKSCLSGKKWLKTSHGYKSAKDSILLNPEWDLISQFIDLPLIDSAFYGVAIHSFKNELKLLGVTEFASIDNYVKLWIDWGKEKRILSLNNCSFWWKYMSENWNPAIEITMLPATTTSGSVQLINKEELFIPDDLQLKKLFAEACAEPLFVWLPEKCSSSPTPDKMLEIYTYLGVENISTKVKVKPNHTLSSNCILQKVHKKDHMIGKSLIKIVLAFLAKHLKVDERHKMAKSLSDLSVFETDKLMKDSYTLQLPLRNISVDVEVRKLVVWQKTPNRLLVQKSSLKNQKENIEFVRTFAREISVGLLPYAIDLANSLCKVIEMGYVFELEDEAVDYLLTTENLEISAEDKELLDHIKPSCPSSVKRKLFRLESSSAPETPPCKKPR